MANKITEDCTNCGACEAECPTQAISQGDDFFVIDAAKCDECKAAGGESKCKEVCPVECIVPGKPQEEWPWFYIDPDTCIDCGACVPVCPVSAIFAADDLPEKWKNYTEINAKHYGR